MDAHLSHLDSLHTVWSHQGAAADAVRAMKYRRDTSVISALADALPSDIPAIDMVTWCPASRTRRRERGFDQAELLARAVAHRLGRPCRGFLVRLDHTPQTAKRRDGRLAGPELRLRRRPRPKVRLLVIDDVVTTGATLGAAARLLKAAGAGEVHGRAVTRAQRRAFSTS